MFATIGRTWGLMKSSWAVLRRDKELILFPIMSAAGVLLLLGIFAGIGAAAGSLDRIDSMFENQQAAGSETVNVFDVVLLVLMYISAYFVVIFFSASLIAAARERLRGGNPNVASGLRATVPHIGNIFGWAVISGSVGLILQLLRSRSENNILGRIALGIVGGIWAYLTFFVVPFLVVEGIGPIEAIKRSASLFKRTWGEQFAAGFGFGIFYLLAGVVAIVPAALLFALSPVLGIAVGVFTVGIALSAIAALEGIFKAALFSYAAEGYVPAGFDHAELATSYQPK